MRLESLQRTLVTEEPEAAGITLVAIAREDGFEVFAHPHRIREDIVANVA